MRRICGFATVIALLNTGVAAVDTAPQFEKYKVPPSAIAKPASVRLDSHPKARTFRTVLRDGAKEGPNFAGHFTIVKWGCGTACISVGVVDALSGEVYFPRQLQPLAYQAVTDETPPLQYRLDSRLLVVAGSPMDREGNEGIYLYVWSGRRLKEVHRVPKDWPR